MTELEQLQASAEQAAALLQKRDEPQKITDFMYAFGFAKTSAGELARITGLSPPRRRSICGADAGRRAD